MHSANMKIMFISFKKKVTFRCTVPIIPVVAELQCYDIRYTFV